MPGKRVYAKSVSRVRISFSPHFHYFFWLFDENGRLDLSGESFFLCCIEIPGK